MANGTPNNTGVRTDPGKGTGVGVVPQASYQELYNENMEYLSANNPDMPIQAMIKTAGFYATRGESIKVKEAQAQQVNAPVSQISTSSTPPTRPDATTGDYWDVVTKDGQSTSVFNGDKFKADMQAWTDWMNKNGYPANQYHVAPQGTTGQIGSGVDMQGNPYSAMRSATGGAELLNPQQIQQRSQQFANPQTSADKAMADKMASMISSWGMGIAAPRVTPEGGLVFDNPRAFSAYTGAVSQRMLDVMRNGGTMVDGFNAGGYSVVARESDAARAAVARQQQGVSLQQLANRQQ